jgi:hypothetical protein
LADIRAYPFDTVSVVIALLSKRDFERARSYPGFAGWSGHSDFLSERDALFVGYGAAGVSARFQRVPFEAFESWSRLTGAPLDGDGLDEFAAHWRWRNKRPRAPVVGRIGAPGCPERNIVAAGDAQCVVILPQVYVRWRDDYAKSGLLDAPGLDAYAAHVVDCCLARSAATRPAVSSA